MVYVASWDEFVERSVQLFRADPHSVRYVMKYRHCDGKLVLKVTDNREIEDVDGVKVLKHNLFTNNIVYLEVVFDMSSLKQELLQLVPLFCQSLLEMGTKDMDFVQLNHLIGRKTGGIHIYPFVSSKNGKNSDLCAHIIVRGKALPEQVEDLFNLINCILQEFEFKEKQRFKQFVAQSRAEMEAQIKGNCSSIAATRINAKLNVAGWINEQLSGISYLEFLQDLEKKIDDDWDKISILLEEIRKSLLSRKGFTINMTSDEENLAAAMKYLSKFVDSLPTIFPGNNSWETILSPRNEAIVIPTQVNYVGKAANIYESGYQLHGSVHVISKYVNTTWLWDRLRTSGSAYGGGCNFDALSGNFHCWLQGSAAYPFHSRRVRDCGTHRRNRHEEKKRSRPQEKEAKEEASFCEEWCCCCLLHSGE